MHKKNQTIPVSNCPVNMMTTQEVSPLYFNFKTGMFSMYIKILHEFNIDICLNLSHVPSVEASPGQY